MTLGGLILANDSSGVQVTRPVRSLMVSLLQLPEWAMRLIGLAMLATGVAHAADDLCGQVERLAASSADGFRDYRGAPDGDRYFESKFVLPGATRCYIAADENGSYWCVWEYSRFRAPEETSREARAMLDGVQGCFRDGYVSSRDWTTSADSWGLGTLIVADKALVSRYEAVTVVSYYVKAARESDRTSITLSVEQLSDYPRDLLGP
jgi:hypothetical protein